MRHIDTSLSLDLRTKSFSKRQLGQTTTPKILGKTKILFPWNSNKNNFENAHFSRTCQRRRRVNWTKLNWMALLLLFLVKYFGFWRFESAKRWKFCSFCQPRMKKVHKLKTSCFHRLVLSLLLSPSFSLFLLLSPSFLTLFSILSIIFDAANDRNSYSICEKIVSFVLSSSSPSSFFFLLLFLCQREPSRIWIFMGQHFCPAVDFWSRQKLVNGEKMWREWQWTFENRRGIRKRYIIWPVCKNWTVSTCSQVSPKPTKKELSLFAYLSLPVRFFVLMLPFWLPCLLSYQRCCTLQCS